MQHRVLYAGTNKATISVDKVALKGILCAKGKTTFNNMHLVLNPTDNLNHRTTL